jgi:hypothetical protein
MDDWAFVALNNQEQNGPMAVDDYGRAVFYFSIRRLDEIRIQRRIPAACRGIACAGIGCGFRKLKGS